MRHAVSGDLGILARHRPAVLDGATLITKPTVTGLIPAVSIDVPVTGGQLIDLIVGDARDGNANDHGDRANPVLICSG
jgi:hypothetical protein